MFFCVNLDPPIKQGQTRYHYLVFNFKLDDEVEIELPFTEEELQEKYDGKLEKEMSGETYKVVSKVLKVVTGKKITGTNCIKIALPGKLILSERRGLLVVIFS